MLSKTEFIKIQNLANLKINPKKFKIISKNLQDILDYVGLLSKCDTKKYSSSYNASGLLNVVAKDNINKQNSLTNEQALQNASSSIDGYFKLNKVIDSE